MRTKTHCASLHVPQLRLHTSATLPEPDIEISRECRDDYGVELRVVTVATVILVRVLVETAIFGRVKSTKTPSHLDKIGWVERELEANSPFQVIRPS